MYYIFNFIVYSIIGFIVEIIFKGILNFKLHSGTLYGPYCPVYGFGMTLIYYIYEKYNISKNKSKFIKYLLLFFIPFLLLSFIELIGGYLIKLLFHKTFWNYNDFFLNIGPFISLEMSVVWAVGAILSYYFLKPIVDKMYFKLKKNIIKLFFLIMCIDAFIKTLSAFYKF